MDSGLNRLARWEKTGETTQDYIYNADGMRVRVTLSGGKARDFLLDRAEVAEAMTGTGNTSYVGPGVISEISGATQTIYHPDGIGSTRAVSNSSEAVQEADIYDAYGNAQTGFASNSKFAYAGQYRYYNDGAETGLQYLKARYYDPAIGRFISRDPIGFRGGMNLYVYCKDNPVSYVDPFGLWYLDINLNLGLVGGLTGGLMINGSGIYPYLGGGFMSSPGAAATVSVHQDPTPGWNMGAQLAYGLAGQMGRMLKDYSGWFPGDWSFPEGDWFYEGGLGTPGASLTGYYVWDPYTWDEVSRWVQDRCGEIGRLSDL